MDKEELLKIIKKINKQIFNFAKAAGYSNTRFDHFARIGARLTGRPLAFNIAMVMIVLWIITGPIFGFSDTWQLVINTTTTIVTFLMVFLLQHSQNRDTEALQVKIDELIRTIDGANKSLLDLEEMEEHELTVLRNQYIELAKLARNENLKKAGQD
jgi:low affinity Fe/Cu permease